MAAHIIVFQHGNFRGAHRHIFNAEPNLAHSEDGSLNDQISSMVVLEGTWRLYRHVDYVGQYVRTLGPGLYPDLRTLDIEDNSISSMKAG